MRELIRDSRGATRGYYVTIGDRVELHSPSGALLGYYLVSQDKTFDKSGSFKGFGNQLTFLLKPLDN